MKLAKFLRTPYFTENLQWLLLIVSVSGLVACNFIKKQFPAIMFFGEFGKFLRASFDRALPDDCFLILSMNFEKFFRTSLS